MSGQTVARYLDVLVDVLLVRRLQPWAGNDGKRLVRAPNVYVRDSGILHALLGIENKERLLGHPVAGSSWEGFVIDNLLACAPPGTRATFYRTAAGAAIDLLLEMRSGSPWAIEVKRSASWPNPAKGFILRVMISRRCAGSSCIRARSASGWTPKPRRCRSVR